jgi:DNA-binding MarR family transcriptional regulator
VTRPRETDYAARLERAKAASPAQLLFRSARLLEERALARLRRRSGLGGLRRAHTALFPHIDLEGTRLTVLAERVGVSKQAVGQLVSELEAMQVLERHPDPADGRAKLICFSRRRGRDLLSGLALLGQVEDELAERLGRRRWDELSRGLRALDAELARDGQTADDIDTDSDR